MTSSERVRRWRKLHPEKTQEHARKAIKKWRSRNKASIEKKRKIWVTNNPDKVRAQRQRHYAKHGAKVRAAHRKYSHTHRKQTCERQRRRLATDLNFRMRVRLRSRIVKALNGVSRSASTLALLGCSIESFWLYLESLFEEGMTRENYGAVWEVDHKIPCALFDLTREDHQRRCFHFSNLQPLFCLDNKRKGANVLINHFSLERKFALG